MSNDMCLELWVSGCLKWSKLAEDGRPGLHHHGDHFQETKGAVYLRALDATIALVPNSLTYIKQCECIFYGTSRTTKAPFTLNLT